jgi:hypothetical protein
LAPSKCENLKKKGGISIITTNVNPTRSSISGSGNIVQEKAFLAYNQKKNKLIKSKITSSESQMFR